jgi:hypothetical protein
MSRASSVLLLAPSSFSFPIPRCERLMWQKFKAAETSQGEALRSKIQVFSGGLGQVESFLKITKI